MSLIHSFPFAVAYADTDAGGIVYHGRYIEMAERARMNWLRGCFAADGDLGFVVRELEIKYMHPLRLGDEFVIESEIVACGAASLDIKQKFVKGDVVCAIINLKAAYLGADMRPKRIPEAILAAMK